MFHRPKISLLIPFSTQDPIRERSFKWLLKYWLHELPDAEIIIGRSKSRVFCKNEALNDAARRSRGKVLVILDADAYLSGRIIHRCADRMLEEQKRGNNLWYVPYRRLYRLTKKATERILVSDPKNPFRYPSVISNEHYENTDKIQYGHRYGAMIMMFPREAYELIGQFDLRFSGWGGEDIALVRTFDTLFGKHKTVDEAVFHLWHPFFGETHVERKWEGQDTGGANSRLNIEYYKAHKKPKEMRRLIDEGKKFC